MVQQLSSNTIDTRNDDMDDFSIIDSGIQAAEGLVHAILGAKRRLSFSSSSKICCNATVASSLTPRQWPKPSHQRSTTKRSRLGIKKSVVFSDKKRIHVVESADDVKKSLRERWYEEDEYKRIKDDYIKTLVAYTKANMEINKLEESEHCIRGLETQISILIMRMPYRNRQQKVVKSVLSLQQVQKSMKQPDSAALREMSLIISQQDNVKAFNNASADYSLTRLCTQQHIA